MQTARGEYEKWITEEGLVWLEGLARDSLTDEQIAHNVGVSRSTLNDWKKKYPDISNALKPGFQCSRYLLVDWKSSKSS